MSDLPLSPTACAELIREARVAQAAWAKRPARERAHAMQQLRRRVLERAQEVGEMLREECGKPFEEAVLAEVLPTADLIDYWVRSFEELLDLEHIPTDPLSFPKKSAVMTREPRGVVLLIVPWNYPFAIPLRTLVPALLAGNAVILKPSEVTPGVGELLSHLCAEVLPPQLVTVLSGGPELGATLVEADVDAVVFTGSVAVGRRIGARCGELLKPCSLELGGKDAAVVLADAPIERTARGLVWGAFTNAGQNCASIERVVVVKERAAALTARIVELTRAQRERDRAKLTTDAQLAVVREHLADALARGAEQLTGESELRDRDVSPIVLRISDPKSLVWSTESFGPFLPIFVADDEAHAIALANDSRYGLTASLWTADVERAQQLASQLRVGVVSINNHGFSAALPQAAWTGVGETGSGITNSRHCLSVLTRVKTLVVDRNRQRTELWWYPYSDALRGVALHMAVLRGGGGIGARVRALFGLVGAFVRRLREG